MPNEYEEFLTSVQRARSVCRVYAWRWGLKRVHVAVRTGQWWWRPYRELYYGPYWELNGHGLLVELPSVRLVKWYWLSLGIAMYETQGGEDGTGRQRLNEKS